MKRRNDYGILQCSLAARKIYLYRIPFSCVIGNACGFEDTLSMWNHVVCDCVSIGNESRGDL